VAGQSAQGQKWPLEAAVETRAGVPVVVLAGRVSYASAGVLAAALEEAQAASQAPGAAGLVLDLSRVDYISSSGLQAIEAAAGRLGRVVLVAPPEPVRIAVDLAGLLPKVTIESTLEAGVIACQRGSPPREAVDF